MANNTFVIDDGTKEYTLTNSYGKEICKIHIRSGEIGVIDRYNTLMGDFDKIVEPLNGITLANDGTAKFDEDWATLKSVEQAIIDKINAIFDFDEAAKIFETRNAFSSVGGEFFVEKVLLALGEIVRKGVEEEAKKTQKRVDKYMKDLKK